MHLVICSNDKKDYGLVISKLLKNSFRVLSLFYKFSSYLELRDTSSPSFNIILAQMDSQTPSSIM